ncbi:low choriolytic enzyme-like [Clavelina lepadiformis]|uniref:Metalloendopeptidase n=1 Tax=Clavelina lepadiformis TaxID=159417 RepID=A0ABP0FXV7_CLALP
MLAKILTFGLLTSLKLCALIQARPTQDAIDAIKSDDVVCKESCSTICPLGHERDENGCLICGKCNIRGMFEGDIIIGNENSYHQLLTVVGVKTRTRRAAQKNNEWPKTGDNVNIGYVFDDSVSRKAKRRVMRAIQEYNKHTCIRFVPKTSQQTYLKIYAGDQCSSYVGKVLPRGGQDMFVGDCSVGSIMHELMHAVGFWHEHTRPDRDNFVAIKWANLAKEHEISIRKLNPTEWDKLDSPYDYNSIMHYPSYAYGYTSEGEPVMTDKMGEEILAQRTRFSTEDIRQINRKYDCPARYLGGRSSPEISTKPMPSARTTSKPLAQKSSCKNTVSNCERLVRLGGCEKGNVLYLYMKMSCKRSCQMC